MGNFFTSQQINALSGVKFIRQFLSYLFTDVVSMYYIYIYLASHHSAAEHRASTRILHLTLFLASDLISIQFFLTPLASLSTVLRHVFLVLPLPRLPWGFHSGACLAVTLGGFHSVWPSHPHLRFLICKSIPGCFVHFYSSSFVIWSSQKILSIFFRQLLIKIFSLAVIIFEFFQVSQPLSRTAFMVVLKMRSFDCVEYAIECQILFSTLNVIWAFCMWADVL